MASIFLSYAREDRVFAAHLARVLEEAGHNLWWDRRLDGGEEFSAEIEAALAGAQVIVVAWSAHSVKSRWVRDEASVGGDTGRLVPVAIDGALPPMGFRQFHTLDLRGWKGAKRDKRTAELLHSVDQRPKAKGVARATSDTPAPRSRLAAGRGKPLWAGAAALLLVIAGAGAIFINNWLKTAPVGNPTIALVPFATASDDPQLRELASEIRDSVAHTFSQSGLPLRLMSSFPQDGRSGADFVISGDLSNTDGKVVAAVRLDQAAPNVTVFSHRFEATADDVPNLAERVGAQMAGDLTWAAPLMILDRRHPLDPALIAGLLGGYDFAQGYDLAAYQNAKRVAAKAPNVQIAQISFAFNSAFVLDQIPRAERSQVVADARGAADRAMKLGRDFGDTYATWCLLHSEVLRTECERQLRAGRRVDPDAPFLNSFLSQLLRSVGRFEEATELAGLSYAHDPYVPTKIGWMLLSVEYQGDSDTARDTYRQGVRWWPEFGASFFNNRLRGLIERGDFDAIRKLEKEVGRDRLPASYRDSGVLAVNWKSPLAARAACSGAKEFYFREQCMLALSGFGDFDGAYAIADKLYPRRVGATAAETEKIWLDDPSGAGWPEFIASPAAALLRRDPRYLALAQRIGLLAYWRSVGPPDFCRTKPEPICPKLLAAD